jgi:hypothetical protein
MHHLAQLLARELALVRIGLLLHEANLPGHIRRRE